MKKLLMILNSNMSGVLTGQFRINIPIQIAKKAFEKGPVLTNVELGLSIGKEGLLKKTFKELEGQVDKEKKKTVMMWLDKKKTVLLYLCYDSKMRTFGEFTVVLKKLQKNKIISKPKSFNSKPRR